jgi:hypothetical protein
MVITLWHNHKMCTRDFQLAGIVMYNARSENLSHLLFV